MGEEEDGVNQAVIAKGRLGFDRHEPFERGGRRALIRAEIYGWASAVAAADDLHGLHLLAQRRRTLEVRSEQGFQHSALGLRQGPGVSFLHNLKYGLGQPSPVRPAPDQPIQARS
jgi:hypothetical protein